MMRAVYTLAKEGMGLQHQTQRTLLQLELLFKEELILSEAYIAIVAHSLTEMQIPFCLLCKGAPVQDRHTNHLLERRYESEG